MAEPKTGLQMFYQKAMEAFLWLPQALLELDPNFRQSIDDARRTFVDEMRQQTILIKGQEHELGELFDNLCIHNGEINTGD